MDSQQTFSRLLEELEYASSSNLISRDTPAEQVPAELEASWREALNKLQVDAVYFVANAPVIYFKCFEAFDLADIARFHRNVWNQSLAPLIFVILPDDIRVYNGYKTPQPVASKEKEPPRLDTLNGGSTTDLWIRLKIFTRVAIESGSFWHDYGDHFDKETRADKTLIANLRYIRQELLKAEPQLSPEHAHSLIGRSIFALYLQDRGVLPAGEDGFFAHEFGSRCLRYTDLLQSYEDTYRFFELLRHQFNGDMFPVTDEERKAVDSKHLRILHRLFTIDEAGGGQMLFFWAYNFEFIPIELISSIYEEFLYEEESGRNGAYYTPPMLVNFILNQVLPESDFNYRIRILDPACGSGIFLVEAYRRLVDRWRKVHARNPSSGELAEILKDSIFGIDIKRQALRIAAFSLYLTMLDYIEPKRIWKEVRFPPLIEANLVVGDFFDEGIDFSGHKFDVIVGNPPWESQLTSHARSFLEKRGYQVGDKQIVQAFVLHAPDFSTSSGQIALLCSSKSLLFNRSGPNIAFRQTLFSKFMITKIFDFSALRRFLFKKAIAPAVAIFYTPQSPVAEQTIFYGAPKLTYLTRSLAALVIEAIDLKQLPLSQILQSIDSMVHQDRPSAYGQQKLFPEEEFSSHSINIWKVALWGTNYDYILLQELNRYPSLAEIITKYRWICEVGFNRKGPGRRSPYSWLDKALFLPANNFSRYGIDKRKLTRLPEGDLYYRAGKPERYKAPLVLFKRSQLERRPAAAYLDFDCTYTEGFTGIAGKEGDLLKALTALLNSEIAQYYLFLSSASWGVEREEIKAGEIKMLPFPFLDISDAHLRAITTLVDQLVEQAGQPDIQLERELEELIYKSFRLEERDIQHIRETIQYTIGFFNSPMKSSALQRPTLAMQKSYAEAYMSMVNFYLAPVGRKLASVVYTDETVPLRTVQFSLHLLADSVQNIQEAAPDDDMREALLGLDKLNTERIAGGVYQRRNFRIYDDEGNTVYIIKPAERRFWTIGASSTDVEETIADLI